MIRIEIIAVFGDLVSDQRLDDSMRAEILSLPTEAFLGVRPARQYSFIVIASPAGNYFKSGAPAVSIWVALKSLNRKSWFGLALGL